MTSDYAVQTATTDDACQAMALQVLDQLSQMYADLGIDKTAADFKPDVVDPLVSEQVDPNEIEDAFEDADGDVSNLDMMRLSCAYAIGAIASYNARNHENAWIGVGHAQYWMGVAYGLGFSKGAYQLGRSSPGKSGSKTRHELLDPVRQKARELASKGNYPNASQAAFAIRDEVWEFYKEYREQFPKLHPQYKCPSLYEHNLQDRIRKWLSGLAFSSKSQA